MTNSWDRACAPSPILGDGYVSVIKQIWGEVRSVVTSAVPENNLANIILDYAGIDDFYVFSRVLGIHVPGVATLANWAHTYNIYIGSHKCDFPGHQMSRMGFIHAVATNGSRHLKAKKMRFSIRPREMFSRVQARDYMGIAGYIKPILYKLYRLNHNILREVAVTCAEIMELHARYMLLRLTMKNSGGQSKRETILPEMNPELNAQFWSLFVEK